MSSGRMFTSAVVTGASRGIGRAVAARLASDGHEVVALARSRPELEDLRATHDRIHVLVGDLADPVTIATAAGHAGRFGDLAVWVNNAALVESAPLVDIDLAQWERMVAVNLRAPFQGAQEAMRAMAAHGRGGTIIHMGSLSGVPFVEKFAGLGVYNMTKAGIAALSEMVALEGRSAGVRSIALMPGAVDTEMLRRAAPGLRALATPEDVATLVSALTGPAGDLLSGSTIPLFTNG